MGWECGFVFSLSSGALSAKTSKTESGRIDWWYCWGQIVRVSEPTGPPDSSAYCVVIATVTDNIYSISLISTTNQLSIHSKSFEWLRSVCAIFFLSKHYCPCGILSLFTFFSGVNYTDRTAFWTLTKHGKSKHTLTLLTLAYWSSWKQTWKGNSSLGGHEPRCTSKYLCYYVSLPPYPAQGQ